MGDSNDYEALLRRRITELRLKRDVSEHRMSLDLGKSGAYIRSISSGAALPSLRELFRMIEYFELTPAEFFNSLGDSTSLRATLQKDILELSDEDLKKVSLFMNWIKK